ncbi:class D sortase [Paenibacillus segetis]|uniref:Class A sortase n=1 Tax=Paenibacillus segetis TaxID=1325360 RepID=A0ABQ1Y699_9BACL|nr:class D sortase [Paenibacillus segetis]GGH12949.1 class A sortase [Paenibacillus segetis]
MKVKVVSIALIVIGILVLCYPKLSEVYYDYQQQKLVKEWENSLQNIQSIDEPTPTDREAEKSSNELTNDGTDDHIEVTTKPDFSSYKNMEGILVIDKIDLLLPILHGATNENMKTTVASIVNTGKAGEVGNYAIAGHRNRTFGRNFNRLDELEIGDTIEVDNGDTQFAYMVTEKFRVKPDEVWVLEGNDKDKEITLVTCDPMVNPTHRLIIQGKIVD